MIRSTLRTVWRWAIPEPVRAELFARKIDAGLSRRLLEGFGLHRSLIEQACVDAGGEPIPWYTYPTIEYLDQHDFSAAAVFEFGSGNSTRYWAGRAARVVSVEHDPQWHARMTSVLASQPHVEIELVTEPLAYAERVRPKAPFDVIVIDGQSRVEAARAAIDCRSDGGIILLDNADGYPNVAAILRDEGGLMQIDFNGFGPFNSVPWRTSMFFEGHMRFPRHAQERRRFAAAY